MAKKTLFIIIGIGAVLLLAAGIFFYLSQGKEPVQPASQADSNINPQEKAPEVIRVKDGPSQPSSITSGKMEDLKK